MSRSVLARSNVKDRGLGVRLLRKQLRKKRLPESSFEHFLGSSGFQSRQIATVNLKFIWFVKTVYHFHQDSFYGHLNNSANVNQKLIQEYCWEEI